MIEEYERLSRGQKARLDNIVHRGEISTTTDTAGELLIVQADLDADRTMDELEAFQNFGFYARPKPGAEAIGIFIGGYSDNGIIICIDDSRYTPSDLQEGESCVYNSEGTEIRLKQDKSIEIKIDGTTPIKMTKDKIEFTFGGKKTTIDENGVKTEAELEDKKGKLSTLRDKYNLHAHGGVTVGPGTSGSTNQQADP
jgi:phage baseplate assembly protein V